MACFPSLREITDFEWSKILLAPAESAKPDTVRELCLRNKLDHVGRVVLSGLLPRAAETLVSLDVGYDQMMIATSIALRSFNVLHVSLKSS